MRFLLAWLALALFAACTSSSGSSTCAPDDVGCQCAASARVALDVPDPGGACAPEGLVCGSEGIVECVGPGMCSDPPTCTCRSGRFSCVANVHACSNTACSRVDAGGEDAGSEGGGDAGTDAPLDGEAE